MHESKTELVHSLCYRDKELNICSIVLNFRVSGIRSKWGSKGFRKISKVIT
jgi:hypothetical protein